MSKEEDIRVFLLQAAPTEWDQSERLAGSADLPLTDEGRQQVQEIAEAHRDASIGTVLCGTDEASRTAADLLAQATGAKVREIKDLDDCGLGLWEGLRRQELTEKFPAAFKKWQDDPCSVTAPEGEALREAGDRIISCLSRTLDKHKPNGQSLAVVLRPWAYALVQCWLDGRDASEVWSVLVFTPEHQWRTIPREMVRLGREGLKATI